MVYYWEVQEGFEPPTSSLSLVALATELQTSYSASVPIPVIVECHRGAQPSCIILH